MRSRGRAVRPARHGLRARGRRRGRQRGHGAARGRRRRRRRATAQLAPPVRGRSARSTRTPGPAHLGELTSTSAADARPRAPPDRAGSASASTSRAGGGICLARSRSLTGAYEAQLLGPDGQRAAHDRPRRHAEPRARLAPTAATARRRCSSPATPTPSPGAFSTQTLLIDMRRGETLANLETFTVSQGRPRGRRRRRQVLGRDVRPRQRPFYATLATGGKTYLIKGSVARAHGARDPRERRVPVAVARRHAHRLQEAGRRQGATWRFHVLDLATGAETPLAETALGRRPDRVARRRQPAVRRAASDIWTVPRRRHAARRGASSPKPTRRASSASPAAREPVEVRAPGLLGLAHGAAVEGALERLARVGGVRELEARCPRPPRARAGRRRCRRAAARRGGRAGSSGRGARGRAARRRGGCAGLAGEELGRALEPPRRVGGWGRSRLAGRRERPLGEQRARREHQQLE